jgi:hypothetical protein
MSTPLVVTHPCALVRDALHHIPRPDIYDPKTLAVMDQAFAAIWNTVRADDPFRDYANDSELRIVIGHKLMDLVAGGVTDPSRLRYLTVESLLLPGH